MTVAKSDAELWAGLKKQLAHSKLKESGEFSGGFIYKTETATLDYTLENLFGSFRQLMEMEIASQIFKNQKELFE